MKCENCQIEIIEKYGSGRFCNVKCARSFSTKNKKDIIATKISNTRKKRFKSGKIINWTDKRIRTPEIDSKIKKLSEKMSATKLELFKNDNYRLGIWNKERREHQSKVLTKYYSDPVNRKKMSDICKKSMTDEVRNKISVSYCNMILNTDWMKNVKNGYKSGYYEAIKGSKKKSGNKKIWYKSSYELKSFQILDEDINVDKWYYESIIVPLEIGKNTVVDLEVYYKNGIKKLIEVKPNKLLNVSENQLKFQCIESFAKSNDYLFEIWTEDKIII